MGGLEERALKTSHVWDHMKKVVQHIVAERPSEPSNTVESVSSLVGTGSIVPPAVSTVYHDGRPKPARSVKSNARADVSWAQKASEQIVPPKPARRPADDDEDPIVEEEDQEDKGELPDISSEQKILNLFGEGVTDDEAFRVAVSLKRLLDQEPLAKARFWGKIIGLKRNYFIAETKIDESRVPETEEPERDDDEEEGKPADTILQGLNSYQVRRAPKVLAEEQKGANEFTFYVATSDDLSNWVRLPDVLPAHIVGARAIQKLFTGDLEAPVECQPPFQGVERHLLRAQIARISCGCTISPKDIFTTEGAVEDDEEDDDGNKIIKPFQVKPYEEIPPLNPQDIPDADDPEAVEPIKEWFFGYKNDELLDINNWVHIAPTLLDSGRATKFVPEDDVPEDDEEDDTAPEEGVLQEGGERINPFLSDISHDSPLALDGHSKKNIPCWALRKAFSNPSDTARIFLARSLVWPGAMCYAVAEADTPGAQFQNYYSGYGIKSSYDVYAPSLPPRTAVEFPTPNLKLMKDCTFDDELEFEPTPPAPHVKRDEEEEEEDM